MRINDMANPAFKYKVALFGSIVFLCMGVYQSAKGAMLMQDGERCKYWQAKVDPSIESSKKTADISKDGSTVDSSLASKVNDEDDTNVLDAIECLLKLKGKASPSRFSSGTIGYNLSTRFPPPTVEVAALYYVSYLYHKKWRHAQAMVLMDSEGKKNTKKSIKTAYKAYQIWFEKVKGIGLERARQQNLTPLDGTDVRWY
jgi:hypothetical protein